MESDSRYDKWYYIKRGTYNGSGQFGIDNGVEFDYENSTMHAVLHIDGATVMLSDNPMGKNTSGNVQVLITLDSKEKLDKIYEKVLKHKFTIIMPLEKRNWGSWYTMFEDSDGVGWQLNYTEE